MPSERPRIVLVSRCLVQRPEASKFLLIKRSKADSHHPELWEWPGGKLDEGQDLSHAQEREVMEETGLLIRVSIPFATYDSYTIGNGPYKGLPYVAIFSITTVVGGVLKLSNEHSDHAWVSYRTMLKYDLTPEVRKAAITMEPLVSN